MKKCVSLFLGIFALASASSAGAQTFTPAGTWSLTGPISITFGASGPTSCSITASLSISNAAPDSHGTFSHGHSAIMDLAPTPGSSGLCGTITFPGAPYSTTYAPINSTTGTLTTLAVRMKIPLTAAECVGDVPAIWDQSGTPTLTLNNVVLTTATSGTCTVNGTLTLTSPSTASIS